MRRPCEAEQSLRPDFAIVLDLGGDDHRNPIFHRPHQLDRDITRVQKPQTPLKTSKAKKWCAAIESDSVPSPSWHATRAAMAGSRRKSLR